MNKNNKSILTLASGHFAVDTYSAFLNPIMPFIALKLGMSLVVATFVISISHICSSIIQPFFGYISDSIKKRFFVFWGLILASVFIPLIGIANSPFQLALFLVFGSMGIAFFHPQSTSFVKNYSHSGTTKLMSIFLACGTMGYSLGPLFSSFIVKYFGLESLAYTSVFGILVAFLTLLFVPKSESKQQTLDAIKIVIQPQFVLDFFGIVKDFFSKKQMRILFAVAIAKCMTVSSMVVFLPFLWKDLGYDVSKIGVLIFLFVLAGVVATALSPLMEKAFGMKNMFYISLITILPLTVLFILTYKTLPVVSYVLFSVIGFCALTSVSINMVLAQNLDPANKGVVSGFVGGFSWGVVGVILPITGFVAEKIGIPALMIAISLIPTLCAFLVKHIEQPD